MASYYSELATKQNSPFVFNRGDGNLLTPEYNLTVARITTVAGMAVGELMYLAKLPKGAMILGSKGQIISEDPGTGVDVTIGDLDATPDADRYSAAVPLAEPGAAAWLYTPTWAAAYRLTQESWITATFTEGGSFAITAGQDVIFLIPWVMF